MALIIKEIRLEVSKPNLIQAIVPKKNDCNSRFLKVSLWDEGKQIPIRPTSEVTINAERKDGTSDSFFGEVNEDNTVTVPLHSWILELDGHVNCDVSIIVDDRKLTTTSFVVAVEKASNNSDDVSDDPQHNVLVDLIAKSNQKFASSVKETASGNPLVITDVSPLEHEMAVQLLQCESSMKYEPDYDKRLRDGEFAKEFPSLGAHKVASIYTEGEVNTIEGSVTIQFEDGERWVEHYFNDVNIFSLIKVGDVVYVDKKPDDAPNYYGEKNMYATKAVGEETFTPFGGGSLIAQGKNLCPNDWEIGFIDTNTGLDKTNANYIRTKDFFTLDKHKTYFVSGIGVTDSNTVAWYFYDENKAFIKRYVSPFNRTISVSGAQGTIPEETAFYRLVVNTTDINVGLQIELGRTATEFEPYVEPITYTADENGNVAVPSIYPTTTLIAENGVTISAEYNADTKKYIDKKIAELAAMLVSQ